jgi:membrane protein YqaA with SNARE-associated domain
VTDSLLATLGLYGGTLVIAFVAGMFPLVSIEVFLGVVSRVYHPGTPILIVLIGIAAFGHQIAKTVTYFAGIRAMELPRGRVRERIDAARERIDRWNKRPGLILVLGATVGFPPMYLLGFIAAPLMHVPLARFTIIGVVGRIARYATIAFVVPLF